MIVNTSFFRFCQVKFTNYGIYTHVSVYLCLHWGDLAPAFAPPLNCFGQPFGCQKYLRCISILILQMLEISIKKYISRNYKGVYVAVITQDVRNSEVTTARE